MALKKKDVHTQRDRDPITALATILPIDDSSQINKQNFKSQLDCGQALIWTSGPDKLCNYFNSVWLEFTGHALEQEVENGWIRSFHPDDIQRCLNIYFKAFDKQEKFSIVHRLLRNDGEYRWVLDAGSPRYDKDNKFIGYIGHCLDITEYRHADTIQLEDKESKCAQDAQRENEERFRDVLEYSLDASYKRNLQTNSYDYLSPGFTRISGYTPDEMMSMPVKAIIDMIHPEDLPKIKRLIAKSISNSTSEPYRLEYRIKHKNGHYCWFEDYFIFKRDGNGKPLARIGSVRDITDRKTVEDRLAKILHEQKLILETANVGISKIVNRKQLWVNRRTAELFQYSVKEMEGQTTRKLYPSQEAYEQAGRDAYPVLAQGQIYDAEQKMLRGDGTQILVRYIGRAVEPSDLSKGTIWLFEDITEQKQAEKALKNAHVELEQRVLERTADLEKSNATLAMMLDYARKAEIDIQERVMANLRTTTLQLLDALKKQQLSQGAHDLVELLERNTQNLAHPLARNLESLLLRLTPREIQVANFIRQGKSNKDIMQLLNLSYQTVESHRNNLRAKLGLRHKKINLRTYLNSEFVNNH